MSSWCLTRLRRIWTHLQVPLKPLTGMYEIYHHAHKGILPLIPQGILWGEFLVSVLLFKSDEREAVSSPLRGHSL